MPFQKRLAGLMLSALALLMPQVVLSQHPPAQTIAGLVAASGGEFDHNRGDFDILLNAVIAADLVGALDAEGADLTVLAPNDRAFLRLARDLGYEGFTEAGAFDAIVTALTAIGDGNPIPVLTDVLLYHVSPGAKTREEIVFGDPIETLLEGSWVFKRKRYLIDGEPDLRNPWLTQPADLEATNGIIQTISRVLIPVDLDNSSAEAPSITDIVAASGGDFDHDLRDFDILLNAVLAAGLADTLAAADADVTVFAPTDVAFVRLARLLGYRGFDEEGSFNAIVEALTTLGDGDPIPVLTDVLLYHVSPGSQSLNSILASEDISTLLMDATLETNGFSLVDADPGAIDPLLLAGSSDIRANNGLIHTINRVLLPVQVTPSHP